MNDLMVERPRRKREKSYAELAKVHAFFKENGQGQIVYPGKGLSSSEIRARVKNRSLKIGTDGFSYSDGKEVAAILGMNKTDLMRSHANETPKIEKQKISVTEISKKLDEAAKDKKREAAFEAKARSSNEAAKDDKK